MGSMTYPAHGIELELTSLQLLGKQLRRDRLAAGFTQKELAQHLGRLTPYIQGVECGVDDIDPTTIYLWQLACGVQAAPPSQLPINANPPTSFDPPPGEAMRQARLDACLTQVELAHILHCSQSYVCQVENDVRPVSDGVYRRWLRACGLPTSTVLSCSTKQVE